MQTEIIVDGQPLELSPDTVVVQSFQANNLERPDQIQTNYTNRFEIPSTQANRLVLEFADQVTAGTRKPYRKLSARILAHGVETVPFGICALEESKRGAFSLQVFSGNKDFFATLGDKSIRDVALGEFDHDYTLQNVINSRGHQQPQGYVYDIIHRGKEGQESTCRWNDLYPSTFVRTIWDKIFQEAGFTYQWIREDDGLFDKLLLPAVAPAKLDEEYRKAREIFVSRNLPLVGQRRIGPEDPRGERGAWVIDYDKTSPNPFFVGDANRWAGDTYTADGHYYVDALLSIQVSGEAIRFTFRVEVQLLKNDQEYAKIARNYENTSIAVKKTVQDFILMDEQKILLKPGDTLKVRVSVHKVNSLSSFLAVISIPEGQGLDIRVREDFPPGAGIRLNSWLPDISQREFVKSIIHLYGLMMQTDSYTQTIRINYFSDLLKRLPVALDWSDKLTLDQEPVLKYKFGSFAQVNTLAYQGEEEVEVFANGELVVDNENLEEKKDIITLPYAATSTQAGIPFIEMFKVQKKQAEDDPTEYDEQEAAPRILIRQDVSMPYTYLDENDNPITLPDESRPISRFLPELHFKNYIIPRYYDAYQAILSDTKFVKARLLLTPEDIAGLDHSVPVWLDYFKAYFYVNLISEWRSGQSCEVELVRL